MVVLEQKWMFQYRIRWVWDESNIGYMEEILNGVVGFYFSFIDQGLLQFLSEEEVWSDVIVCGVFFIVKYISNIFLCEFIVV